jgi:hypothetical protein
MSSTNRGALTTPVDTYIVPALIADAGDAAGWRYVGFFTANIRNPHTPGLRPCLRPVLRLVRGSRPQAHRHPSCPFSKPHPCLRIGLGVVRKVEGGQLKRSRLHAGLHLQPAGRIHQRFHLYLIPL